MLYLVLSAAAIFRGQSAEVDECIVLLFNLYFVLCDLQFRHFILDKSFLYGQVRCV